MINTRTSFAIEEHYNQPQQDFHSFMTRDGKTKFFKPPKNQGCTLQFLSKLEYLLVLLLLNIDQIFLYGDKGVASYWVNDFVKDSFYIFK